MASGDDGAAAAAAATLAAGGDAGTESCGERLAKMLPKNTSDFADPPPGKRLLTTEEVRALDDDAFFEAYSEGIIPRPKDALIDPDKWEEQIDKIPLFMTKAPTQEQIDTNPTLQALQAIVDESTPDEQATYHKDHGNEEYKKGRNAKDKKLRVYHLRRAVDMYTQGIAEVGCENATIIATLHTNRAAANLMLGNNRKAINDCKASVKLNPQNIKAYWRAAVAFRNISKHDEAIEWCDKGLQIDPRCAELSTQRKASVKAKSALAKQQRMRDREVKKKETAQTKLADTIKAHGVVMRAGPNSSTAPEDARVTLDDEGQLHWPAVFYYPEHQMTDFVTDFAEEQTFDDHLEVMFPPNGPFAGWDQKQEYRHGRLNLYCELTLKGYKQTKTVKLDTSQTLRSALAIPGYEVQGHTPAFFILVAGSAFETLFLKRQKEA
eukprot:m.23372 g.23372  ORF g.23372 m.23372 type:complete len:436 (+) comp7152_c0_seq1:237-1544(+)